MLSVILKLSFLNLVLIVAPPSEGRKLSCFESFVFGGSKSMVPPSESRKRFYSESLVASPSVAAPSVGRAGRKASSHDP